MDNIQPLREMVASLLAAVDASARGETWQAIKHTREAQDAYSRLSATERDLLAGTIKACEKRR